MRTRIGIAAVALVVLSGAGSALAQAPQERMASALTRAGQVGIPRELLESKIAEGKAKGVSMERIAIAVERRLAALERARDAMGGQPHQGHAALAVGADALESGVSEAVLATIARTAPHERRAVAIAALTHLVQLGHVPEAALERVREALQRGPEALLNLAAEGGRSEGRRGGPPEGRGPEGAGERGRGAMGPPAGVPAPGKPPQAGRPGGPPAERGKPPILPGAGRGGPPQQ